MYTLRTLDVWDTLIRRDCHPEYVKLATARHAFLLPEIELKPEYPDHWSLYRKRVAVEARLADEARAQGRDNEYEIVQVLTEWIAEVSSGPCSIALAERLADVEVEFEIRHTYADPTIREFIADYPAEKTLFLSDFYMSAERLSKILENKGFSDLLDGGISSCDIGLNKRSGKLFGHVHKVHDIDPAIHVHIGDSEHSDVSMPRSLGVNSVLFLPESEHTKRQVVAGFFTDRSGVFRHMESGIEADAGVASQDMDAAARSAYLLGIGAAPLFVGFVLFIAEQAILDRLDRLFFLTREGEFFLRLWHALFPQGMYAGFALPETQLLQVSRIATFCASLGGVEPEEMKRLWRLYSSQSMDSFLTSLGLDPTPFTDVCRDYGIDIEEVVNQPWADPRVLKLFQDAGFKHAIEEKIRSDRDLLGGYLEGAGWRAAGARLGVVDIGWRGSIQDNLALLYPDNTLFGYYLGLQRALNPKPDNCVKRAFGPDVNRSSQHAHLLDAVSVMEMLCNSPGGSVVAYRREADGSVRAERMADSAEDGVFRDFTVHFQRGVLAAADHWSGYIDNHVMESAELRDSACRLWEKLVTHSNSDLSLAYASLRHNDLFGAGGFVDKGVVPSIGQLVTGVFNKSVRHDVILYIRQTQWSAGVWGRKDLGLIHRTLLVGTLRVAAAYKRFHYWKSRV